MDKFHLEPKSWEDLFEFIQYNKIDSEIFSIVKAEASKEKK